MKIFKSSKCQLRQMGGSFKGPQLLAGSILRILPKRPFLTNKCRIKKIFSFLDNFWKLWSLFDSVIHIKAEHVFHCMDVTVTSLVQHDKIVLVSKVHRDIGICRCMDLVQTHKCSLLIMGPHIFQIKLW